MRKVDGALARIKADKEAVKKGRKELVAAARSAVLALDAMMFERPLLASRVYGVTTIGNLRAELSSALQWLETGEAEETKRATLANGVWSDEE